MGQNQPGFAEVPVACFGYSKKNKKQKHIQHYIFDIIILIAITMQTIVFFFIKRINADKTYVTYDVTI